MNCPIKNDWQSCFTGHKLRGHSLFWGEPIWVWINTYRYSLLGDEHPFTSYFDVHQGYKVLTHCHIAPYCVSYWFTLSIWSIETSIDGYPKNSPLQFPLWIYSPHHIPKWTFPRSLSVDVFFFGFILANILRTIRIHYGNAHQQSTKMESFFFHADS